MTKDEARRRFAEIALRNDDQIRLDETALLIAAEEYPSLRLDAYLSALDEFALDAKLRMNPQGDVESQVLDLRDYLFSDLGFSGNQDDYFDARNSFLSDVIDTRLGIPITLSIIFIEVARRLRLPLMGVGMPGHFIVRFNKGAGVMFFDPFDAGRLLTDEDCRQKVSQMYGDALAFHPSFLAATSNRQILSRMLQNLKGIYARSGEHSKLLSVVERGILLRPSDAAHIRDRGLALAGLGRLADALSDLEEYLRMIPEAADKSEMREKIGDLRQRLASLN